ncbi:MAG: DUF3105 domain-containing protein [Actinomycetota bacterium]|nr:DUF3105 domain-containing protein [Actinomycetota bacterium]
MADDSKKQKRDAARQARIQAQRKRQRAKRRKQIMAYVALGVIVVMIGGFSYLNANKDKAPPIAQSGCGPIKTFAELTSDPHIKETDPLPTWNSYPPTSGFHLGVTAPWGVSQQTVDDRILLHNLQHGGVVIHYKGLTTDEKDKVESLVDSFNDGVVSNPNPKIDHKIVMAAWTHLQKCDRVDAVALKAFRAFIKARCNKGQEAFGLSC